MAFEVVLDLLVIFRIFERPDREESDFESLLLGYSAFQSPKVVGSGEIKEKI